MVGRTGGVFLVLTMVTAMAGCSGDGEAPRGAGNGAQLAALFDHEWDWRLREFPLLATSVGDHRYDDRLPVESPESYKRRGDVTNGFLAELARIDRSGLQPSARIDYDVFKVTLEERRDSYRFGEQYLPLNADSGFHSEFALVPQQMRFASVRDYETYLERLRAFPRYTEENIGLLREGLRTGVTIPRASLAGIETTVAPLA